MPYTPTKQPLSPRWHSWEKITPEDPLTEAYLQCRLCGIRTYLAQPPSVQCRGVKTHTQFWLLATYTQIPELPDPFDTLITHADGNTLCPLCESPYKHHAEDLELVDYEGKPFLRVLCNGKRVKL